MIEVLKLALKALNAGEHAHLIMNTDGIKDKVRQAIAELESQEPVATVTSETGADITMSWWHEPALPVGTKLFTHPPQRTEQNYCPRCGKRTNDIHTCTPPRENA
jgi:hypothetical protein